MAYGRILNNIKSNQKFLKKPTNNLKLCSQYKMIRESTAGYEVPNNACFYLHKIICFKKTDTLKIQNSD